MLCSGMGVNASTARRWLGALVLAAAVGMLVVGETALKGRLDPLSLFLYWMACLVLTGLAVLIALLDVRSLRRKSREAERDLISTTLKDIEIEARERTKAPGQAD